jgi:hypothetical protein
LSPEKKAWRAVLEAEVERWSAMPLGEAITRLEQPTVYEIEIQQKKYQMEVELLRDTGNHLEHDRRRRRRSAALASPVDADRLARKVSFRVTPAIELRAHQP